MSRIEKKIERAAKKAEKAARKSAGGSYDFVNSKAMFVLKIITMSFLIITCVIVATVMLSRWISDLNAKVKASKTQVARAAARMNKFRKRRMRHILKLRKLQLKEEKENRRYKKKYGSPEYTVLPESTRINEG